MAASIPPGWHHALQPPLTYRVGPRLYFVDRTGTPWRVRSVYIAPPDWRIVVRVPPFAREYCSRLFVDPSGKRMLYSPKYDRGAEYNPDDWSAPTLRAAIGPVRSAGSLASWSCNAEVHSRQPPVERE